jgi:hypothetical protein
VIGFCEHGSELSGSIKGRELRDQMSNYNLPKKELRFIVVI